jgi:programmed cell death protein 5
MESMEELKEKKKQALQQKLLEQQAQQQKEAQAEQELDGLLRSVLTPEAKTRLANIRLVNKRLYLSAAQSLLVLAKSGRLPGKITDEQLKALLSKAMENKKEMQIRRK